MVAKVNYDNLEPAIWEMLDEFASVTVKNAVKEAIKEAADEAVVKLKEGGPYTSRSGKYRRSWTATERHSATSKVTDIPGQSVHSVRHYRLVHLLEKGHQMKNGGRTRAFPHVDPVNEMAGESVTQKIAQKLGG